MDRRRVHELHRSLRKRFPLSGGVALRIVQFSRRQKRQGDCLRIGESYRIRIDADLTYDEALGVLLHEWAHVLSYGMDGEDDDHGELFWQHYPIVVRAALELRRDLT